MPLHNIKTYAMECAEVLVTRYSRRCIPVFQEDEGLMSNCLYLHYLSVLAKEITNLLKKQISAKSWQLRENAANGLSIEQLYKLPEAEQLYFTLLRDRSLRVKSAAFKNGTAIDFQDARVLNRAIESIALHKSARVRQAMAGSLKDYLAVSSESKLRLMKRFLKDEEPSVRRTAMDAVASFPPKDMEKLGKGWTRLIRMYMEKIHSLTLLQTLKSLADYPPTYWTETLWLDLANTNLQNTEFDFVSTPLREFCAKYPEAGLSIVVKLFNSESSYLHNVGAKAFKGVFEKDFDIGIEFLEKLFLRSKWEVHYLSKSFYCKNFSIDELARVGFDDIHGAKSLRLFDRLWKWARSEKRELHMAVFWLMKSRVITHFPTSTGGVTLNKQYGGVAQHNFEQAQEIVKSLMKSRDRPVRFFSRYIYEQMQAYLVRFLVTE